jgi:hypothetical protein
VLVRGLIAAPTNASLQNAILARIHRSRFAHLPEAASETVYEIALHALAKNSLPAARNFALDIGRWHFGRCRPGKKLTASDEQVIQKHVLACCR